jgi:hypothetical protein
MDEDNHILSFRAFVCEGDTDAAVWQNSLSTAAMLSFGLEIG